jgi:hypothetical protein
LSFGPDTPDEVILREAKEAGIGLTRAYLQSIRNPAQPKPSARRGRAPAPNSEQSAGGTRSRARSPEASDLPPKPRSLIDRLRDMLKDPP